MSDSSRVFVSYARADEHFATALREKLALHPDIVPWMDRIRMVPGDFEEQLLRGIENAEHFVLVVTPAALRSPWVQRECRHARAHGVCISPIQPRLDPDQLREISALRKTLPPWMARLHVFDLEREWAIFVQALIAPCQAVRTPFMAAELPAGSVHRSALLEATIKGLLDGAGQAPSGATVVLHGAGGFGKTTLALAACHDARVSEACDGGVLWATLGTAPSLVTELEKLYAALTGKRPGFKDPDDAMFELAKVLDSKRCLLVIDDVWSFQDLKPFLHGGRQCCRLVTTRRFDGVAGRVAEHEGASVEIDVTAMQDSEAEQLLATGLAAGSASLAARMRAMAKVLHGVPLLLRLANRALHRKVKRGDPLDAALGWAEAEYAGQGASAFDDTNAKARDEAVASTIGTSLAFLAPAELGRCRALGIFPADADIPFTILSLLWGEREAETQRLVESLDDLALLDLDLPSRSVRLHDMLSSHYAGELEDAERLRLHARFADAWKDPKQLTRGYAVQHVAYHVVGAMHDPQAVVARGRQLIDLLTDARFSDYQSRNGDAADLDRQLARALEQAAASGDAEAPGVVVALAALKQRYAQRERDPERVFRAVAEGRLDEAVARLELFGAGERWTALGRLLIAWLAPPDRAEQARDLVGRTAPSCRVEPLRTMLEWVQLPAGQTPANLPRRSSSPDATYIAKLLQRAGGAEGIEGLEPLNMEALLSGGDASGFIAEQDGPLLVDFAWADPGSRTAYLDQYIQIHAANRYRYYRNRSLWALLGPVLTFADAAWVKRIVQKLVAGALSPASVEFEERVGWALAGLEASTADGVEPRARLERRRTAFFEEVRALRPDIGETDTWSIYQRRACALAETYAVALGEPRRAAELLTLARDLPKGLAGFRMQSALQLAESSLLVDPADESGVERALLSARAAAHRIQDPAFCLQATAWVNAIERNWRTPPGDLEATIERLANAAERARANEAPLTDEFCSLHRIGENFRFRAEGHSFQALPIPESVTGALTVRQVAAAFGHPPEALEPVNGWIWKPNLLDAALDAGDHVRVVDRDLLPILAARLAAFVLGAPGLSDERRCQLIQRLVAPASSNRTVLDTVLARLLLAARVRVRIPDLVRDVARVSGTPAPLDDP